MSARCITCDAVLSVADASRRICAQCDFAARVAAAALPEPEPAECEVCGGTGEVMYAELLPGGHTERWRTCDECDGTGRAER